MHEIIAQILTYARGAWRHRWYLVGVAWVISVAGWIVVYQMPDEYEATARVYIDTNSVLKPLLRGLTVDTGLGSQISIMTRTLLSRPNMEKLARMTDLDLKVKDPAKMDALLTDLKKDIRMKRTKRVNLYTISYEHSDPKLAKRIVQSLLTIFIETTLGASRKDSDSAQKFLDAQIREYEAKLVAAENRLKEFKRKNIGVMPGSGEGTYYRKMENAMGVLAEAKLSLQEAVTRRDEIKKQMEDAEPELTSFQGEPTFTSPLDSRIHNLQVKMDELLLNYTQQHPDVIGIKRTIAQLEKQKKQEMQASEKDGEGPLYDKTNPVYQQMKIALTEAEANVASLSARVKEYDNRVISLKKLIDTIPQVEAELKNLDRDYNVHKKNYNTLLARRESAIMSQSVEQISDNVKFKIIDPPHVPSIPSSPNRPLLMSGVLFLGLGVGTGMALLIYMIRPSFDTRKALTDALGLPVLGSVSMIWSPAQIQERRKKIIMFGSSALALMIIYSLLLTHQLLIK